MKNTKIVVNTKSKSYPIYFGDGNLNTTGTLIKKNLPNVKKICIISDKNLPLASLKELSKSLKKYNPKIYRLSVSEKIKNFKIAHKLIENILNDNLSRSDCIISFGGGILGDLSAFISSLTKRGIKFVNKILFFLFTIFSPFFKSQKKNFLSKINECFSISPYPQIISLRGKLLSIDMSINTNSG